MRHALCLLVACFMSVKVTQAQPPDLEPPRVPLPQPVFVEAKPVITPYQTLTSFIDCHNDDNWASAPGMIDGAERDNVELENITAEIVKARGTLKLDFRDANLETEGDDATMTMAVHAENHLGLKMVWRESIKFHRRADEWLLRPIEPRMVDWNAAEGYLQRLIVLVAHPKVRILQFQNESAHQIKQLSLGVMQFIQDHDQKFAFTQETFRNELRFYVKSGEIWTAPGDEIGKQSYEINPNLIGRNPWEAADVGKTVQIYLGHNGKLDFRYDGKTVVGFVDRHVEILDAEQAKNLRWTP